MKNSLTPKQQAVLDFVKSYRAREREAPLLTEIKEAMKFKSLRSVTQILEALERKGFVQRNAFKHRGIVLIESTHAAPHGTVQVPVVASAGCDAAEIYAQEQFDEYISVDSNYAAESRDVVAIKAVGNSMVDAGINNGDYVLVEPTQHVTKHDRVVAIIGDMAVIKRYRKINGAVVLSPENKDGGFQPIVIRDENARIFGKVLSVIPKDDTQASESEVVYEPWYKNRVPKMTREEMAEIVTHELETFLPRINGNVSHNMVRSAYNMLRYHDLAQANPEGAEAMLQKAYEYASGIVH